MASETASFDYIVVGGGTAGLVVANRLSESPDTTVAILEAGDDMSADPRVNIPGFWTTLLGTDADWQFKTVAQSGLNGRCLQEPQGKALGGSSAINSQSFVASGSAEIDAWASLGNEGWKWADLAPYYKKAYTLLPPEDQGTLDHLGINWIDEESRGRSGPLQVSFPGILQNPICKAWIEAFRSLEKTTTADPFTGKSIGAYSNAATVDPKTKTRSYAASAYGLALLERPNVRIITKAMAQDILLERSGSEIKATGVKFSINGKIQTLSAKREVILAAGAINTPKLLELSGIGQAKILKQFGIPVVVDLPGVGENLQDHLMTGVSYEVNDGVITGDPLMRQEPEALAMAQKLYTEHQAGPFTMGGFQSHAFMTAPDSNMTELLDKYTPDAKDGDHFKAVRSIVEQSDEATAGWFIFLAQANLHEGAKNLIGKMAPENFASLGLSQSHPFSRGMTHISSSNPTDPPLIDPKFFSHPADLEIMARHLKALEDLRHSKELSAFLKPDGKRNHPDSFHVGDLDGARKYILDTATTTYHSCGTAAMLPREKGGVVSPSLKVYGTSNLRVVDASMIPIIPRGNIQSTVYAVAEKAADIIRGSGQPA